MVLASLPHNGCRQVLSDKGLGRIDPLSELFEVLAVGVGNLCKIIIGIAEDEVQGLGDVPSEHDLEGSQPG